jgi:hypothetical protein
MEVLQTLLTGMEVPFPFGFTLLLAIVLYLVGHRSKKSQTIDNDAIPWNNLIIGILACLTWEGVNYLNAVGMIFLPIAVQYTIIAVIAGITAAGGSTLVYELLKNKAKKLLEAISSDTEEPPQ